MKDTDVALRCNLVTLSHYRVDEENKTKDEHYDVDYHAACAIRIDTALVLLVLCHEDLPLSLESLFNYPS